MAEILPDATLVIDFLNGQPSALEFALQYPRGVWLLHSVVEAEVLVGACDREELRIIERRLAMFERVRPTGSDFDHCLASVRRLTLSHGIGWPDCLIAATALRLSVPIATLNDKHFRSIRGVKVVRSY